MHPLMAQILAYHAGRDPERLAMKLAAMTEDPFVFFRGSCHLFYQDWHSALAQIDSPNAWLCGDMHVENVGTYQADNGLAYFDLNDFDEAILAPCLWELTRLLSSVLVAQQRSQLAENTLMAYCEAMLDRYAATLATGKAKWVERKTARGAIKALLAGLSGRRDKDFLADRTRAKGERLRIDGRRTLGLKNADHEVALTRFRQAMQVTGEQDYFAPRDIARRIAGTGSLGVERYVVLVAGDGPGRRALIDMKASTHSALSPYVRVQQPAWPSEAARIVSIQAGAQVLAPALLKAVTVAGQSYVIKALQPTQDRLDLRQWQSRKQALMTIVDTMAQVCAWGHLRNAGWLGAASREALMAFGANPSAWRAETLQLAKRAAEHTVRQWHTYVEAYRQSPPFQ